MVDTAKVKRTFELSRPTAGKAKIAAVHLGISQSTIVEQGIELWMRYTKVEERIGKLFTESILPGGDKPPAAWKDYKPPEAS